jgi:DNA-binding transcriptional LysR family regulator
MIRVGPKTAIRPMIDDTLAAARLNFNWRYEVDHVETAVNLVDAGLACAIVPGLDIALHRGRGLAAVLLRSPRVSCTYGFVSRRGMPLSPPATSLRRLLVDEMKAKSPA